MSKCFDFRWVYSSSSKESWNMFNLQHWFNFPYQDKIAAILGQMAVPNYIRETNTMSKILLSINKQQPVLFYAKTISSVADCYIVEWSVFNYVSGT